MENMTKMMNTNGSTTKTKTSRRKETLGKILTLFLGIICFLGITIAEAARYEVLTVNKLEITRGGSIEPMDTLTFDLGAAERLIIDASTTAQTQTNGVIDLNVSAGTANVSGFDLTLTTPTGTASGTDVFAQKINLIQNDADADMFGLKITGTATTNAAAGSYEYLMMLDCAENTAGACPDGLLVTSSGVNAGMTDGIDVSAANITNGINLGPNILLMTTGDVNADTLNVDTTDDMTFTVTAASAGEDFTIDQNGNVDASILISTEGNGTDAVKVETITNGGDIIVSSVDNIQITSTTASGLIDIDGTAGLVYSIAEDDTTADDIDIGSAKDDVDIEGEDITLDTADDGNATVADDWTFTMESAGGIFDVTGTAGFVVNVGTDDTVADDINIGSVKDDITLAAEDITLTTADDMDLTSTSAGGIIALGGTAGQVFNVGTDDTTLDDINIGSAKDTVSLVGSTVDSNILSLTAPRGTSGSGTGVTVDDAGSLRTQVYKVTVAKENFTSAAVSHDLVIWTAPAKTIVHSVLANVSEAFVCGAVCTTATLSATLGVAAAGVEYLESFDVDAATGWFGDADAEVGSKLDIAANTNGGYPIPAGGAFTMRGTSGTGNWGDGASATNLTSGSLTFYILYSVLP